MKIFCLDQGDRGKNPPSDSSDFKASWTMPNCVWERWHSLDIVDLRKVLMMGRGKFRSTLLYPSTRTRSYVIRTSFFRTIRLLFFMVSHGRKLRSLWTLKKGGPVQNKGPPYYNVYLWVLHHFTLYLLRIELCPRCTCHWFDDCGNSNKFGRRGNCFRYGIEHLSYLSMEYSGFQFCKKKFLQLCIHGVSDKQHVDEVDSMLFA